jgi:hypothetical protein
MIEGIFYIESQGNNEKAVKTALEDLVEGMKSEKGYALKNVSYEDVVKDGENYSTSVEVELKFKGLMDYLMASIRYVPYAIILDSPKKMSLSTKEFLKIAGEITAVTKKFLEKKDIQTIITENAPEKEELIEKVVDENSTLTGVFSDEGVLSDDEIEAFLDQGALKVKIVMQIEGNQGGEEKSLIDVLGGDVFIHKVKSSRLEGKTLVAILAFVYEPKTLLALAIRFQPILIEIIELKEVGLSLLELQDIGIEVASIYFDLAHLHLKGRSPS